MTYVRKRYINEVRRMKRELQYWYGWQLTVAWK